MVFTVPPHFAAAQRRIALHDVNFPLGGIPAAAVHKFFHTVGKVDAARQLFLEVQAGLFGVFPAALVDEHLLADFSRVIGIFDEIDLHLVLEELGHALVDELIGDGFFGLVFVGGLGGKAGGYQHQTVLHVLEADLAFVLEVLVVIFQPGVDLVHQRHLDGALRRAAVLQKAGIVVVFGDIHPIGKAEGDPQLDTVILLIGTVPTGAFRCPVLHGGQGVLARQLLAVIPYAVLVAEGLLGKGLALLVAQQEFHAGVDHRLPLQHIGVVGKRDSDIGEYRKVGLPTDTGAGLFAGVRLRLQPADVFALLKVQVVALAVPQHLHVHVFRGILGGAGAETV